MNETIDKVFDLLEKVYIELQDFKDETRAEFKGLKGELQEFKNETKAEFKGIKGELQETKAEVKGLKADVNRIEVIIENEIKPDIKMLFGAQVQTNKKLEEHDQRFDFLENKFDMLSAKVLRHSYEIGALKRKEKNKSI